jgi:DNA polymerase
MKCSKCDISLHNNFTPCLRDGNENDIMLIGEAPGHTENRTKIPFTGKSGTLIREFLHNYGLDTNTTITNVVKCQPDWNRDPRPYEINNCKAYLLKDIAEVKPKLIILAGKIPMEFFFNKTIAYVKPYINVPRVLSRVVLVPIYHPSFIIRNNYQDKYIDSFNIISDLYSKINPYYNAKCFNKTKS